MSSSGQGDFFDQFIDDKNIVHDLWWKEAQNIRIGEMIYYVKGLHVVEDVFYTNNNIQFKLRRVSGWTYPFGLTAMISVTTDSFVF
jgi:hypothetical protein